MVKDGLGNEPPTDATDRRCNFFDDAVILRRLQQRLQNSGNITGTQKPVAELD